MTMQLRILAVLTVMGCWMPAAIACNQHPPDVSHERWLAQIAVWNKEYDAKQAAKAQVASAETARTGRTRGRDDAAPDRVRTREVDPQVRTVGDDDRRSRRYR